MTKSAANNTVRGYLRVKSTEHEHESHRTRRRRWPTTELARQECAIILGGPTAVIDVGGLRIVGDPTFDDAGPHGYLTKTVGPAVTEKTLGRAGLVVVSHDTHPDNLDERGLTFA
ncbi:MULTISPECIES: hypothetical protein [unclassified Streptomyces]|uniref:hypothetical protein n=1 Tax=unclassified Streptomyces TaxID=2593676 RepID=UPI0036763677